MSFMDRVRGVTETPVAVELAEARGHIDQLSQSLRQEQDTALLLEESVADLQLALEDEGWSRMALTGQAELTHGGLINLVTICRLLAVANPLIKRGLNLRHYYVWALGVQIEARAAGKNRDNPSEQDVNQVVQDFLDDEGNREALTGEQACEENERALGTDGNLFLALFTSPLDGRVQVRVLPFEEIVEVVTNPDDRSDPWLYLRRWTADVVNPLSMRRETRVQEEYYPALGFRPARRGTVVDDKPVNWDAPVLHVRVNGQRGWRYGVPDAYAAVAWARMYQEFLGDWAKLVKSLSRFAWRLTAPTSKARKAAAAAVSAAPSSDPVTGRALDVGATAAMNGNTLEAIPKSGATIDSESGKPLAGMVAAGLDVPVTMLLADPGQTGARAVAETLDRPTELMAASRRKVWSATYRRVLGYVIDSAVRAPAGPLKGTRTIDRATGREVITLAGDTERTVEVTWPDLDEVDAESAMKALAIADQIGKTPDEVMARLVLQALKVEDVDEIIDGMLDDQGNFVPPKVNAGQAATDAFRRGEDPAAMVGGGQPPPPVAK